MSLHIKRTKRVVEGDIIKCIDDDLQYGLKKGNIYTVRETEKKSVKGKNRKIELDEIRGKWNRNRFLLI